MSARTIKGAVFTIVVDDKRIIVKHVFGKGKRCRVTIPPGVSIEGPPKGLGVSSGGRAESDRVGPKP